MDSMKFFIKVWISFCAFFAFCSTSVASPNIGTITRVSGDVQVLSKATKTPKGEGWIKFEDLFYKNKKARVGYKLKNGDLVHTYSNGKAMVIFPNGDQISVGPGTSYEMKWNEKEATNKTVLKLLYGKVRGVVSPKGPRNLMKVETKTAVAGVRGTDFSVASVGNKTEVSVLRGKVSLTPKQVTSKKENIKSLEVSSGFVGKVELPKSLEDTKSSSQDSSSKLTKQSLTVAEEPSLNLKKITKEALIEIQTASTITQEISSSQTSVTEAQKKEVIKLEEKAKEVVLEDIKKYNPEDYKALQEKKSLNLNEINTSVVSKLFKEAPQEVKDRKFSDKDFEDLDSDIYEKYFK